jgi:uncharacterized membrane protein YeaQ/YmgE (transglycosylase-associated protein family)
MVSNLILTLVIGVLVGWLAGRIMKGDGYGILGDLVLGILGAFVGGWILGILGLSAYGLIGFLVMSVVGAVVLIAFLRMIKKA